MKISTNGSLFIVFEGPDGSGKSTQARHLALYLRESGYSVLEVREPGGTPLGERIRELALSPESPPVTPLTSAFLMCGARAELVSTRILPALQEGHIVIADRFSDSTLAYQSFGHGVSVHDTEDLIRIATCGLQPDVVLYIDVPVDVGMQRTMSRSEKNRMDAESRLFHTRVREGYLHLLSINRDRWVHINGDDSVENIKMEIATAVTPHLERFVRHP